MKLRQGAWAMTDQGIGIWVMERLAVSEHGRRVVQGSYVAAAGETIESEPWVHLVNPDGTTLAQLPASRCKNIRQAKSAEIPASRIGHLSASQLAGLGYV